MFAFFLIKFFVFIFGLCIGSFLNCVIYRLSLDDSSLWKNLGGLQNRSYCPHCKHPLMWLDLIPVFSFLFLKSKCRYCAQKISIQYPIIEILTGLIFLLIFIFNPPAGGSIINQFIIYQFINLFFLFYIASVLIVIFVYDLKYYLIPDKILFPAIAVAFAYRLFHFPSIINYLGAVLIAFTFFGVIYLISRGRWMGFGDVKLAVLLGLLLGFPVILAGLFLSFFFGAIIGLGLILFGKKGLKSQVPFAPFLIIGTFVALFWGEKIINWYTHFLIF